MATLEWFEVLQFVTTDVNLEKSSSAKRQDRLILAWLYSSVSTSILPRIANCIRDRYG